MTKQTFVRLWLLVGMSPLDSVEKVMWHVWGVLSFQCAVRSGLGSWLCGFSPALTRVHAASVLGANAPRFLCLQPLMNSFFFFFCV